MVVGCVSPAPPFPQVVRWDDPQDRVAEKPAEEQALWDRAEKALAKSKEKGEIVELDDVDAYLAGIAARLWVEPPEPGPSLQLFVFEGVEENAYAWPNGTLMISSRLLATLENEAQLAYLVCHEIAHILLRHSLREDLYQALTGSHVDRMKLSKYAEQEADRIGFERFVAAGYAAIEAPRMMRHLDDGGDDSPDRIRSWETHADLAGRVAHLERLARGVSRPGGRVEAEQFLRVVDRIRLDVVELEIEEEKYAAASARIEQHLARKPSSGRAYYLRAEVARRVNDAGRRDPAVRRDYERAIELDPGEPDALRALGLLLRGTDEQERSDDLLARYLEARPDAIDRRLIARYLGRAVAPSHTEDAGNAASETPGVDLP